MVRSFRGTRITSEPERDEEIEATRMVSRTEGEVVGDWRELDAAVSIHGDGRGQTTTRVSLPPVYSAWKEARP